MCSIRPPTVTQVHPTRCRVFQTRNLKSFAFLVSKVDTFLSKRVQQLGLISHQFLRVFNGLGKVCTGLVEDCGEGFLISLDVAECDLFLVRASHLLPTYLVQVILHEHLFSQPRWNILLPLPEHPTIFVYFCLFACRTAIRRVEVLTVPIPVKATWKRWLGNSFGAKGDVRGLLLEHWKGEFVSRGLLC